MTGAEHRRGACHRPCPRATAAQVRLAWTLQRGEHALVIPGTGNLDHLDANVAAAALRLTGAELARLQSLQF